MTDHVAGHVMGQTQFGHVTFPRSRASEVLESRFVTGGPVSSYLCRRWFVVYQMEEVSFEFVIWWEHHFTFMFPKAYGRFHGQFDEFKLVTIAPFFHKLWLFLLFLLDSFLY